MDKKKVRECIFTPGVFPRKFTNLHPRLLSLFPNIIKIKIALDDNIFDIKHAEE